MESKERPIPPGAITFSALHTSLAPAVTGAASAGALAAPPAAGPTAEYLRRQTLWAWGVPAGATLQGYGSQYCTLDNGKLKGIYSLTWWGGMLGAAGKDGVFSVFKVPAPREVRRPLQPAEHTTSHSDGAAPAQMVGR
jgi:hypothetical protein